MNKFTTVDEFLASLNTMQLQQVELLRQIIKNAHPDLEEHIKWNAPSFVYEGEDRITMSVRPGAPISLVLHMGAVKPEDKNGEPLMEDKSGLIEWKSDIRGVISFKDAQAIEDASTSLNTIVNDWLKVA